MTIVYNKDGLPFELDNLANDVQGKINVDFKYLNSKAGKRLADIMGVERESLSFNDVIESIYPVGAIYIGTQTTCPLSVIGIGTWELVSSGRVIQGADSSHVAGTQISAGLPNITGTIRKTDTSVCFTNTSNMIGSGALYSIDASVSSYYNGGGNSGWNYMLGFNFNASSSNSIYGASSTVQPPAYIVNIWERTE